MNTDDRVRCKISQKKTAQLLLLHTKYFSYASIGKYDSLTKSYNFNFRLKWFDQINKNSNSADDVYADPLLKMGAKDYFIFIKWS